MSPSGYLQTAPHMRVHTKNVKSDSEWAVALRLWRKRKYLFSHLP